MSAELKALKTLALAATSGPWKRGAYGGIFPAPEGPAIASASLNGTWCHDHTPNEEYIAAANPAAILALIERLGAAEAAPLPAEQPSNPAKLAHGHREDYYLMANARRLAEMPIHKAVRLPNWVLAMELFSTGGTSACRICRDAGIDPEGLTVARIVGQQTKGGSRD